MEIIKNTAMTTSTNLLMNESEDEVYKYQNL